MPRQTDRARKRAPKVALSHLDGSDVSESETESVSDYQASSASGDDRCSTPESQKDSRCGVCRRTVNSSDKSLQCDTCSDWCHIKCGGVTKEHYRQMVLADEKEIAIQWECPPCLNAKEDVEPPQQTVERIPKKKISSTSQLVAVPGPPAMLGLGMQGLGTQGLLHQNGQNGQNGRKPYVPAPVVEAAVRDLPFYPVKATLLRPAPLAGREPGDQQQQSLAFYLSPEQAVTVNNGRQVEANGMVVYKMHILLRFTKPAPDNVQDDDFPRNLCLKVNNKVCPLPNPKPVPANRPNLEAKRPPKPLIITSLCKLNTKSCLNQVSISYANAKDGTKHTVSVYLVEKLTPADLLKTLKMKGQRDPTVTRDVIQSKLEDKDDEISTTSCKVSMACPLGMARMTLPCRASTCDHLQCFDADLYLKMNEKKPKWLCPVCNKPAYFEHLFLDGFYIQLLLSPQFKALTTNDIILNNDASWEPVEEVVEGVSDSEDEEEQRAQAAARLARAQQEPVTLDDDDDISVIPLAPLVDRDGAPLQYSSHLQQPALRPPAPVQEEEEDLLIDRRYPPETDYMDWNFSVKFFQFFREPPPPSRSESPPVGAASEAAADPSDSGSSQTAGEKDEAAVRGKGRGARGGKGGRAGGGKRPAPGMVPASSGDEAEPPTKVVNGSSGRGRGARKPAQPRKRAPAKSNRRKRKQSSDEDDGDLPDSGSEAPAAPAPPPVRTSSRPARNSRKITNYAALEDSGDVLDYFLEGR